MAEIKALSKILHVREIEKDNAQKAYQKAMAAFEEIATQLYSLLKKKEIAEVAYDNCLQQYTAINKIKDQSAYIEQLNTQIIGLQLSVQKARIEMESTQDKLTAAHVEVKKFENIIEHRQDAIKLLIEKQEKALMDDVSIQQYLSRKIR